MAALEPHILMPELVGDQFPLKCFSNCRFVSLYFKIMTLVLLNEEVTVDLDNSLFFLCVKSS